MGKKKVLIINNAKVFLTDFGGYSIQVHHLFRMFEEEDYELFYLALCVNFDNGRDFFQFYTLEEIARMIPAQMNIVDRPILRKVRFFSIQDMSINVPVEKVNRIVSEHAIDLVFFLGDVILFEKNAPDSLVCPSLCWYPCHFFPINANDRRGLAVFDTLLCLSPSVKIHLETEVFPHKTIHYLPHVTGSPQNMSRTREEARFQWKIPPEKFVVLVNASLYEETNRKAIDCQMIGFKDFLDIFPDAYLLIHSASVKGRIPFTAQTFPLQEMAQSLQFEEGVNMTWNRRVLSSDEMEELYRVADVLLSCSKSEGFGVPILEAQRYPHLRVITSDFLSMREHNFQGHVTQISTPEYNCFQSGRWTVPSSTSITQVLTEVRQSFERGGGGGIRRSNWIVSRLTQYERVRDRMFQIIKTMSPKSSS